MNTPTTPNPDVLINFVLDASGSMGSVYEGTIKGFDAFIAEQREQLGEAFLTLTTFHTRAITRLVAVPLADVGSVRQHYSIAGMTALMDAIGGSIKDTEEWQQAHPEFTGKVVCVILTDGMENASRTWHLNQPAKDGDAYDVGSLIKHKQEQDGWEFMFLGSGGSAWLEKTFGGIVDRDLISGYDHTAAGNTGTYASASAALSNTRSMGGRFVLDPQDQK